MAKTIAWADQSGDVITLTAPAWSGSQTVTLSTPENFGELRELNIVFYSESNPAVSATLNVKQAGATLSLSDSSVTFESDETSAKTITVTTNMSTLSEASLVLEGGDSSSFTLSGLSALSGGKATFTINPNSVNSGQSARSTTVKLTAGRLTARTLSVTQKADAVVSVTYENYRLEGLSWLTDAGGSSSTIISNTVLPARTFSLTPKGAVKRTKVTSYASGKQEREDEVVSASSNVGLNVGIQRSDNSWRYKSLGVAVNVGAINSGTYSFPVDSLGEEQWPDNLSGTIKYYISETQTNTEPATSSTICKLQGNKRESYSNYSNLSLQSITIPKEGYSGTISASAVGDCSFTSGAVKSETMALLFESDTSWISLTGQTPIAPGSSGSNTATISVEGNSTSNERGGSLSVYPRLVDGSKGGDRVGYCTINQERGKVIGALTIKAPAGQLSPMLGVYYGIGVTSQNLLIPLQAVPYLDTTWVMPETLLVKIVDAWRSRGGSNDITITYQDFSGSTIYCKGRLNQSEIEALIALSDVTLTLS